jgi:hypothetical protein
VADRDRAAEGVDPVRVELGPLGQAGQRLGCECLVELHDIDVREALARPLERAVYGADRPDPEELRCHGVQARGRHARQRLDPECLHRGGVGEQERGGPVREL